jgi:hypothetical protein
MARGPCKPAQVLALLTSLLLLATAVWATSPGFGTVVSAQLARVGVVDVSAGTTIFVGDRLSTGQKGSLHVRAGAARLLLTESSAAIWGSDGGHPTATLTAGTAVFSTANSSAFALRAGPAIFRPKSDEPTVGAVTLLSPKELAVRCSRGVLTIAVGDDVREIPEGAAYHVILDPNASPPPGAAPARRSQNSPRTPGRSNFIWYAIGFVALATGIAVYYAYLSPDRP